MGSEQDVTLRHDSRDDDGVDDDKEGCETELMALVVVDSFPIEARNQRVNLTTEQPRTDS